MNYIQPLTTICFVESINALCNTSGGQGVNPMKGGEQLSPARKLFV